MGIEIIVGALALIFGAGGGYVARSVVAKNKVNDAEKKAERIISDAEKKQKEILLEAKDEAIKITEEAKKEETERRSQILNAEKRIDKREETLDARMSDVDQKQKKLEQKSTEIKQIKQQIEQIREEQSKKLEQVANLSARDAKDALMKQVEEGMQDEVAAQVKKYKTIAKEEAKKKAKEIIGLAIERYARDQTSEMTSTSVSLPSDEMKGRIIGKEGRNIRRLEELTGVEIVVDDTPNLILVTGFNPIRRHVAKKALEYLIKDGRIHPARIEEIVQKVKVEIATDIKESGEEAVYDLGINDLHPKLVQLVGRLKFRSSYGQNVLKHSIEVANIAAMLAEELGADVAVAKRAALLHDIGKAVDHEVEGTHLEIGRNLLKKFGCSREIIHGMECHHNDYEPETVEALIVNASDAISGGRVGARKDTYENYVKRLEELENLTLSFDGVEKAYAIQAGREVRVFVRSEEVTDAAATTLARDIANKIEKELTYPGEIKVNIIRETRVTEYAR